VSIGITSVVTDVRALVNDSNTPYRYSDATLMSFLNLTLNTILQLRPDLFNTYGDIVCTTGEVLQSAPVDSHRIVDVIRVKGGNSVREVNRLSVTSGYASWMAVANGTATDWMRHPRDPNRFYIYPPSSASQELVLEYTKVPTIYTSTTGTITELPLSYSPTVVSGIIALLESVDDEHVSSGRAKMYMDIFMQNLGLTLQNRPITDMDGAGLPSLPKESPA